VDEFSGVVHRENLPFRTNSNMKILKRASHPISSLLRMFEPLEAQVMNGSESIDRQVVMDLKEQVLSHFNSLNLFEGPNN